jgi:hypothetical protein
VEEFFRLLTRAEFFVVQASGVPPTRFNNEFVICYIVQQPYTRMRLKLGIATQYDCSTRFSHHQSCLLFAENEILADKIIPEKRGANRGYFGEQNFQP